VIPPAGVKSLTTVLRCPAVMRPVGTDCPSGSLFALCIPISGSHLQSAVVP